MIMKNIFREYDIRGIFNKELNQETVYWIGYFLGKRIKKFGKYVAIGYDARTHSVTIFNYLSAGLGSAGLTVLDLGLVPTPNNYFANYIDFDGIKTAGSIMITGSHNPPEYNGFKITINKKPFFGEDIYQVGREVIFALNNNLSLINSKTDFIDVPAKEKYISFLVEEFKHLKNFKQPIVYDVGNGVAGVIVDEVLKRLNISAKGLFTNPDGTFPNHHPDPTVEKNLQDLKNELATGKYAIGFAFDGDADRLAVLTEKNNIKGDILAIFLAQEIKNPVVIGEVKCSNIFYDKIKEMGGKAVMTKTGHSNIKTKIRELNADFGIEVSGHIFFNDRYFGFDDAIYSMFRVLELVAKGINLDDEVAKLPKLFSTNEIKIKTSDEIKFQIIEKAKSTLKNNPPKDFPKIKEIIDVDGIRVIFENGWGLVRASNTTPMIITRFEATTQNELELFQQHLTNLITKISETE